jgi:hypothetical protein
MSYKELYLEIWQEREHRCVNCGMWIASPVYHNFSHIRSKGARPDLKYDKDNIEILCSSLNRNNRIGCHELSHTNPKAFQERRK